MRSGLDLLEERIKKIIESSVAIFPWMDQHAALTRQLVEAFQLHLNSLELEQKVIPNHFRVYMNSNDVDRWQAEPDYLNAIAHTITETASEMGYHFENAVVIDLVPRDILKQGDVMFKSVVENEDLGETSAVPVKVMEKSCQREKREMTTACLLLDEFHSFPLDRSVINIGRRSSNHLVFDDLRVSRTHAQIRWVQNGFVIFDIGSTGGTYINGERISQHRLQSGDVISLAGITMIYTEEEGPSDTRPNQSTSELKVDSTPEK